MERKGGVDFKLTRYAFISDIHSNFDALKQVAKDLEGMDIFVVGDIVGYGSEPDAVVQWVASRCKAAVRGNHDDATVTGDTSWFNSSAAMAIEWTRGRLSGPSFSYLSSLPLSRRLVLDGLKVLLVHGSPEDPLHEYVFPQTHENLFGYYLSKYDADIIVLGHTHVPFAAKMLHGLIFNPGSVGQPRDGIPKASYSILEIKDNEAKVQNYRVNYDIDSAAKKIFEAGLPRQFGLRLYSGY